MAKITSIRWAEEDDPLFTGRFEILSKKAKIEPKKTQDEDKKKTEDD